MMEVIEVKKVLRKMRGGSQSFFVEGKDGKFYIMKCCHNPQGNRTLVNEILAAPLMRDVGICVPALKLLRLTPKTKCDVPLTFLKGNRSIPVDASELHLGSHCPVDPEKKAIYELLGEATLLSVDNLDEFFSAYVFDSWTSQTDNRQAIFIATSKTPKKPLHAFFIDNGQCFNGTLWDLKHCQPSGLYIRRGIYKFPSFDAQCQKTVDCIQRLTIDQIYAPLKEIPPSWLRPEDYQPLSELLVELDRRRQALPAILERRGPIRDLSPARTIVHPLHLDEPAPNILADRICTA